jgi:hypothetical protein
VGAWPGRHQHNVGCRDHGGNGCRDSGRRVDDGEGIALLSKQSKLRHKAAKLSRGEVHVLRFASVPPRSQTPLRVSVHHNDSLARGGGSNGEMAGDRRLADAALLIRQNNNSHQLSSVKIVLSLAVRQRRSGAQFNVSNPNVSVY